MKQKNSLNKSILVPLVILIITTLIGTTIAAAGIGTNDINAPLTEPTLGSLIVKVTENGKISLSTDGIGMNTGAAVDTGNLRVEKPNAAATVRKAYLMSATTGFFYSTYHEGPGDVLLNGVDVFPWDLETTSSISSWNTWKDVTSIVKPIVDGAPAGIVNIPVAEANSNTAAIDGEALAVIFDDPAQPADNTIVLLFGAQDVLGDTFNVVLSEPADFTDPNFGIGFGLGISFGAQPSGQFSNVNVNGNLLSGSAGGEDDGAHLNGALMTVGGIGDLPNPLFPENCGSDPRCDTERYQLIPPFVNNGNTNIKVDTLNPSNDDNIFFAWFDVKSNRAVVNPVPEFPRVVVPVAGLLGLMLLVYRRREN